MKNTEIKILESEILVDAMLLKENYQECFRAKMKQKGITSLNSLSPEKKKEFFSYVREQCKK